MGILFPLEKGDRLSTPNEVKDITRKREGKGCHLISTVKVLLGSKENWKEISDKNNYHFLGVFSEPSCNVLWYTNDVTQLSHYTLEDPDFLWNDIQFSKRSSTKQTVDLFIGEQGKKRCLYYKAQCNGVKKCCECQHVVPNSAIRNSCTEHPGSPLTRVKDCPVEFVYIRPEDFSDHQRWIDGLIRKHTFDKQKNFHNHSSVSSHRIPSKVRKDIASAVKCNPSLKTSELSCGQGLGYCPASADLSAAHKGRLNTIRRQTLEKTKDPRQGYLCLLDIEKIADTVDEKDKEYEGSENVSLEYKKMCRPYMRKYGITSDLVYQLIMTPLMSRILANSEYIEVDTTYNENTDLPYLLNVTVFDYKVMRWMAVARVRSNRENVQFYAEAFKQIFEQCKEDHKDFKVENLKGIVMDWSDTERKGLELAIGKTTAEKLVIGCLVHYGKSYQRVAHRVSSSVPVQIRRVSRDSFCAIARKIPSAECKSQVMKMFSTLKGETSLQDIKCIITDLSEEALLHKETFKAAWRQAYHWCEWWMRLPHLRMLSKAFTVSQHWSGAPRDTNGVERVNQASKGSITPCLLKAMELLYKKDKVEALSYIAAENNISLTYRGKTDETRRQVAASRKRQRQQSHFSDKDSEFGPPDKRKHFCDHKKNIQVGQRVEVKYDDGVWYKGTLIEFRKKANKWIAQFDMDGEKTSIKFPDEDVRLL